MFLETSIYQRKLLITEKKKNNTFRNTVDQAKSVSGPSSTEFLCQVCF